MTVGSQSASARVIPLERGTTQNPGGRDRSAQLANRRARTAQLAAHRLAPRPARPDAPPAFVGTFDDGLAYDTPRDAHGIPIRAHSPGLGWQVGMASWYGGSQWEGHRMSDGERYQQDKLTAAHATLPLGTLVRVTRVADSRSVVVRITDRPGTRRRIIDLSRAAAAELGMLSSGVAEVRVDPL